MSASERLGSQNPLGARKWTPCHEFLLDAYKIWYAVTPWIDFVGNQEISGVRQILVTLRPAAMERIQEISRNYSKSKKLFVDMKLFQTMVNCVGITSHAFQMDFKQKRCHLDCIISYFSRNIQEISRNFLNNRYLGLYTPAGRTATGMTRECAPLPLPACVPRSGALGASGNQEL